MTIGQINSRLVMYNITKKKFADEIKYCKDHTCRILNGTEPYTKNFMKKAITYLEAIDKTHIEKMKDEKPKSFEDIISENTTFKKNIVEPKRDKKKKASYWIAPAFYKIDRVDIVISDICSDMGISVIDVLSRKRHLEISDCRHVIMYVLNKHLGLTTTRVGQALNRNHASVIHGCKKAENLKLVSQKFDKYKGVKLLGENQYYSL